MSIHKKNLSTGSTHIALFIGVLIIIILALMFVFRVNAVSYDKVTPVEKLPETTSQETVTIKEDIIPEPEVSIAQHIATPEHVKGVYMSSWVAATPTLRNNIISLVDSTEINAIVIDIKDSTGKISFSIDDERITQYESSENRIKNIRELIESLHEKGIYVIGRISVFQDPFLTVAHPELSIRKKSDGGVWKDRKGLSFLDPNNKKVWEYTVAIAEVAYEVGFDEINFDYIRFPSDGNISDIDYGLLEGSTRAGSMEKFYAYLQSKLVTEERTIPMSADLFGMVTSVSDDLGIGQVLEKTLPYFDYIAPMIYPSHYPKTWNGYSNPAEHPYGVVHAAMTAGIIKSENAGFNISVWRPWIQDFDLGATYTAEMVRDQIKALEDLGINSWLVWDPSNKYTTGAFHDDNTVIE